MNCDFTVYYSGTNVSNSFTKVEIDQFVYLTFLQDWRSDGVNPRLYTSSIWSLTEVNNSSMCSNVMLSVDIGSITVIFTDPIRKSKREYTDVNVWCHQVLTAVKSLCILVIKRVRRKHNRNNGDLEAKTSNRQKNLRAHHLTKTAKRKRCSGNVVIRYWEWD